MTTPSRTHAGLRPALAGAHQIHNLRVALLTFHTLAEQLHLKVDASAVQRAVATVRWPGRLQRVEGDPPLLLDGAHNAAGAAALVQELERRGSPPPVLLFGAMRDKDVPAILVPLAARARAIVITQPGVARAAEPEAIAALVPAARHAHLEPDLAKAYGLACALARKEGCEVLVTGSLYLVGEVLGLLEGRPVPGPVPM